MRVSANLNNEMTPQPKIVFVLLGKNPAPTLYNFANVARIQADESEIILITDHPKRHNQFPGSIVRYERNSELMPLIKLRRSHPELKGIAGGYWLFTLERLFALMQLEKCANNAPIIHLESDVLLSMTTEHAVKLEQMCSLTSVPRYSTDLGIASFLYSPSIKQLIHDLISLGRLLEEFLNLKGDPPTDMQLLGRALNTGVFQELPSLPENAWTIGNPEEHRKLVFDGLAYGQYLFGQDPLHQRGMRVSGHQNEHFDTTLEEFSWSLRQTEGGTCTIGYDWELSRVEIANLHIHSKENLNHLDQRSQRWQQAINEANGTTERITTGPFQDTIHRRPKLLNRFRLWKRFGILNWLRMSARTGKLSKILRFAKKL